MIMFTKRFSGVYEFSLAIFDSKADVQSLLKYETGITYLQEILPAMLALWLMLFHAYYACSRLCRHN